jgi:holo-[acyl-carrier protein] synthase
MILGIGTDLCEIRRIERALERFGERFARRILVESELAVFRSRRQSAAYLAKRFAAKEAFSKALGTGIHFPVNWHNVWVINDRAGKPALEFSGPLAELLARRGIDRIHVSLTDEIGMACAFVIAEGKGPAGR